jgi:Fe-S cluster assembly protein SufD
MIEVANEKDCYLTNFAQLQKSLGPHDPAALHTLREAAIERFAELGFPTMRHEDWRFTNLAPLAKTPFRPTRLESGMDASLLEELCRRIGIGGGSAAGFLLVNGEPYRALDNKDLPAGAVLTDLWSALRKQPNPVQPYLADYARYEDHPFIALNTAFLRNGVFLHVQPGAVVEQPLHIVYATVNHGEPAVTHPRNLIVVGANSQVTIVESFVGGDGASYFTNAVTEIIAGDHAVVDHYKLQREGNQAFHIAATQVQLARSCKFASHYLGLGGSLVRNEMRAVLDDPGIECTVNGLYVASGRQHMDNLTVIDHAKPHCASHELYKGILNGRAHGVFTGKIFVRQDAQKTDAKQTNQTLLLSDDAVINTKPQLEIYADDVKCTHGATVGQLQDEAIFYLRSRGIGREEARSLLTYAFANDIIGRVQVEPIRALLEELLLAAQHLPKP